MYAVKVSFKLGMEAEVKEADPIEIAAIHDAISSLLISKTAAELTTPEGQQTLREEILQRFNSRYPKNRVVEVFITALLVLSTQ